MVQQKLSYSTGDILQGTTGLERSTKRKKTTKNKNPEESLNYTF